MRKRHWSRARSTLAYSVLTAVLTGPGARLAWVPVAAAAPPADGLPVRSQDEAVDVGALIRLREALGGTIGQAIRPFLEDMPRYLEDLDAAAAVGRTPDLRYTAHAIKGAAGNLGAAGLAELARELEALSEAGQGDAAARLLPRLRAEYTLVMQELQHELEAEAEIDLPQAAMDAARVLVVDDDRSTRSTLGAALQRNGFVVSLASDGSEVMDAVQRAPGCDFDGCTDAGDGRFYRLRLAQGQPRRAGHTGADDHGAGRQRIHRACLCRRCQ